MNGNWNLPFNLRKVQDQCWAKPNHGSFSWWQCEHDLANQNPNLPSAFLLHAEGVTLTKAKSKRECEDEVVFLCFNSVFCALYLSI